MDEPGEIRGCFETADPASWERREHFEYFYRTIKCKYTLNAEVDVTALLARCRARKRRFFPSFLYVVMRSVNSNREFRMDFDAEGKPGFWDCVHPSYTLFHEDDKTFSDVWSVYDEDFEVFYASVVRDMELYGKVKGVKAKPGRPGNFCPVSALPWLHFTGFSQDTYSESAMLFPLIRFGAYEKKEGRVKLPVAVFVNHASADGYHVCKLFREMEEFAAAAEEWML